MTDKITMLHNPRCSKSRQTLELLQSNNVEPDIIEYLKTPPTEAELDKILKMLSLEPRQLMRTKEAEYRENGLDDESLTRQQLIKAMIKFPKLIERPIVIHKNKAALGRPPEDVLEIL